MQKADATIDKHWLEYPDGIPVESWGRDHNSTILYAETRAVDHGGWLPFDDQAMRSDGHNYPTRLHNGVKVLGHTDFECLKDAQAAGFLTYDEDEELPSVRASQRIRTGVVRFTDDGWTYVHALRRSRAEQSLNG